MVSFRPLSALAQYLVDSIEEKSPLSSEERRITVNPIVTKFASWYERLRNAMEFREDEVILRATIERILKRRLLLGGSGKTTARPLVKELLWARYLPETDIGESVAQKIEEVIDLYLSMRLRILSKHKFPESTINDWTYDLMSSDIQYILNPKRSKELIANFMFHVLKDDVVLEDESTETKNAQVFIAVRKAFARDDLAFLRYHLFCQYFGRLTPKTLDYTVEHFLEGYNEILHQMHFRRRERIYTYVRRRTAAFFILEDILESQKENVKTILENDEALKEVVFEACEKRYKSISSRVRTAIIRSVLFILLTKVAFAFFVEGSYERIVYGHIIWDSIIINTSIPPLLMIVVSLFIRTPGQDNSERIFTYITHLLHDDDPVLGNKLLISKPQIEKGFVTAFNILWLFAFILSFGVIIYILTRLHFNLISQVIFIFFLAIVSFLSYRISLLANVYRVGEKQGLGTFLVDFLFMPVIRVGSTLTQTVRQLNIFLMLFDFFIEAPFKFLFAFFDQWFYFLHGKTEELE
jgi:N-glycosylase/DNA lyase